MKILIVDDEAPIRKYISKIIQDCSGNYEIIGSVGSGKKALDIIKQKKPDLVLADITMPKMTGLELLGKIKESYSDIDVFILTCHNDFEFARTAIKLQADNYILKDEISPVYMEHLLQSVERKREKNRKDSLHQFESSAFFIQLMKEENTLLFNTYNLEKHKIFLKDKDFLAVALTDSRANRESIATFRSSLLDNQEIFPYHDTNLIMVANLTENHSGQLQENLQGMLGELRSTVEGPVGISAVYYRINMLKKAVIEALDSYSRIFYRGGTRKNSVSGRDQLYEDRRTVIYNFVSEAYGLITEKKFQKLFCRLNELVNYAAQHNIDVSLLKKSLQDILTDYQVKSGRNVDLGQIHNAVTVDLLLETLEEMSGEEENSVISYSEAVNSAISYMENNFVKNLSLSEVAERIHLNAEYFSRRFKKETGYKFSEFLLKIRMEEAHRLLLTTDLSVTRIAGETGFNNDSYFSASFKKYFGKNPNEVRKSKDQT